MSPQKPLRAAELLRTNIKSLLALKKLRANQLAAGMKKSQPQISQFLAGNRSFSMDAIDSAAEFFGVAPAALFNDPTNPEIHLTKDQREILDALPSADARTIRAVRSLLDLPDVVTPSRPPISPEHAAELLNELLQRSDPLAARARTPVASPRAGHAATGTKRRSAR